MKKILYIFFFLIGTLHFAQGVAANPFEESEKDNNSIESRSTNQSNWQSPTDDSQFDSGGGNPNPDLPIDDYIPLLILAALGIIIYKTRKNRNLLS